MATIDKLTPGALAEMLKGNYVDKAHLQILAYKKVNNEGVGPKYRFSMSDGVSANNFCVLGGECLKRIERGDFERFTVIQVNKYTINKLKGGDGEIKTILVINEAEVLHKGDVIGEKIIAKSVKQEPTISNLPKDSRFNANVMSAPSKLKNENIPVTPKSKGSAEVIGVCSIETLNPYQNRWAIRGRITSKTPKRSWNNAKGEGTLFSFNIQDESGEIRVTAFKAECDKFYDLIEIDKVYTIFRGGLKSANKQFNNLSHEYEITLTAETVIEICDEKDVNCPKVSYEFVKIKDLSEVEPESFVDIIGVCKSIGDISLITQKTTGKELKKRDISLVDDSEAEISLTLWGDVAENFNAKEGSAVVAKKARVSSFSGRSLSCGYSTFVQVDPPIEPAFGLKGWYETNKNNLHTVTLTGSNEFGQNQQWKSLIECTTSEITSNNNLMTFTADVIIVQTGRIQVYKACTTSGCKKKLIDMNNDYYRCEKCNKDTPDYLPRLIFSFCVADWGSDMWLTAFNEEAEKLLNMSAKEIDEIKKENEPQLEDIASRINFNHYYLKIRAKIENYKDVMRMRGTVISVIPINIIDHGKRLLQLLSSIETRN